MVQLSPAAEKAPGRFESVFGCFELSRGRFESVCGCFESSRGRFEPVPVLDHMLFFHVMVVDILADVLHQLGGKLECLPVEYDQGHVHLMVFEEFPDGL